LKNKRVEKLLLSKIFKKNNRQELKLSFLSSLS